MIKIKHLVQMVDGKPSAEHWEICREDIYVTMMDRKELGELKEALLNITLVWLPSTTSGILTGELSD